MFRRRHNHERFHRGGRKGQFKNLRVDQDPDENRLDCKTQRTPDGDAEREKESIDVDSISKRKDYGADVRNYRQGVVTTQKSCRIICNRDQIIKSYLN